VAKAAAHAVVVVADRDVLTVIVTVAEEAVVVEVAGSAWA